MTTLPEYSPLAFADTTIDTDLPSTLDSSMADATPSEMAGMPGDRDARIAARRAFVSMKLLFMRAVQSLEDRKGQWLRHQVRLASDPIDLWLLRGPVLDAVRNEDSRSRQLRAELYRGLDSIFPEAFGVGADQTLPAALPDDWAAPRGGHNIPQHHA